MSRGMWTKQYSSNGEVFYYNCSLNKSLWKVPLEGVIHEAEFLKRKESGEIIENNLNNNNNNNNVILEGYQYDPINNTYVNYSPNQIQTIIPGVNMNEQQHQQQQQSVNPNDEIAERLLQAVAMQQLQTKSKLQKK